MARRRTATVTQQTMEPSEDNAEQQTVVTGSQEKNRQQLRQRRGAAAASRASKQQDARQEDGQDADPASAMPSYIYYPRQYGGLLLGTAACCNTMLFYEQHDPNMVWKMLAWMFMALLGLALHEFRPFKRKTYQDLANERGIGYKQIFGIF